MSIRKIGGIYWFAIGRLRISFCLVSKRSVPSQVPVRITIAQG